MFESTYKKMLITIFLSISSYAYAGKEFKVFWFGNSDKPHWSHDGH